MVVALLVMVPVALAAEEPTREANTSPTVEPICKSNSEANSRILKGVKGQVQKDELVPAGKRFIRASAALGKAVDADRQGAAAGRRRRAS